MGPGHATALAVLLPFLVITAATAAPTGSVDKRDTDKLAALRGKLQRLQELLSSASVDGDSIPFDGKNANPGQRSNKPDAATHDPEENESADLDELNQEKDSAVEKKALSKKQEERSDYDEKSIQLLAKALARIQGPRYSARDTNGEYLSSRFNEVHAPATTTTTKSLNQEIEEALQQLVQGKQVKDTYEQSRDDSNFDGKSFGDFVDQYQASKGEDVPSVDGETQLLHEKALSAIETRLMRDIQLARTLGVSVDNLIEDLQNKAYREARIRTMERQLQDLDISV